MVVFEVGVELVLRGEARQAVGALRAAAQVRVPEHVRHQRYVLVELFVADWALYVKKN